VANVLRSADAHRSIADHDRSRLNVGARSGGYKLRRI
jgi:hypothetical protein